MSELVVGMSPGENGDMAQAPEKPELQWVMPIVRVTRDQLIEQWGMSTVASKEYQQEQREKNRRLRALVGSLAPKLVDDLALAQVGEAWGHKVTYTPDAPKPLSVRVITHEEALLPPPQE